MVRSHEDTADKAKAQISCPKPIIRSQEFHYEQETSREMDKSTIHTVEDSLIFPTCQIGRTSKVRIRNVRMSSNDNFFYRIVKSKKCKIFSVHKDVKQVTS